MKQKINGTALLVMDMQAGILGMLPNAAGIIGKVRQAIADARNKDIPVIYVVVGFRQGAPEISTNNLGFAPRKEQFSTIDMDAFMKVHTDLTPRENEITIIKRRVSAFTGSDLDVVLRSLDIDHLILTGVATSGVVLSTVREASDKDYRVTILADCCADNDKEVHEILTNKVFPRQATVINLNEWGSL